MWVQDSIEVLHGFWGDILKVSELIDNVPSSPLTTVSLFLSSFKSNCYRIQKDDSEADLPLKKIYLLEAGRKL